MTDTPDLDRPLADQPVWIDTDAYICPEYAREEGPKLWRKVWQVACREEEIAKPGDYVVYEILDDSIIVTRKDDGSLAAYNNACMHRGRRLASGCGSTRRFVCGFHGWTWNLDGENVYAFCREEWEGKLSDESLRLPSIQVGSWGGWVFVNLDPDAEPLESFLDEVPEMLDPFQLQNMRYRWRQWLTFDCNWKVAMEAFVEGYHVMATHPQLTKYNQKQSWSAARGKHSHFGPRVGGSGSGGATGSAGGAADMRIALADVLNQLWEEVNATTTETMVKAAQRLVDELPEGTPPEAVQAHLMKSAIMDDAARGVIWPTIPPEHFAKAGTVWHIFPNTVVIAGPSFALCYRARPNGDNPHSCIFEVYVIELFPEGQEPKPENVHVPIEDKAAWRRVLCQDFENMAEVQRGLRTSAFPGARPNPQQERGITNFHRVLSEYMGRGAPRPIAD